MALKQILVYGRIDSYKAAEFGETLNEIDSESEVVLRINTEGGSPEYGWGMIAMFKDLPNPKSIKVDGQAHSMGAFMLCYVNQSEALDVAQFLIHRAAYPNYFEDSDMFDDATKENLVKVNKDLEAAFRAKIDVAMFEEMKGVTVKEIFSMDGRKEVYLTAKEAKKIGLISKVIPLTSAEAVQIEGFAKAASSNQNKIFIPKVEGADKTSIQSSNSNKMTIEEFKKANPEAFAAIQKEAVDAERDRVGSLMAFHDLDPETVTKAIKDGSPLTATMGAEFTRKAIAKNALKGIEGDSAADITAEDQGVKNAEEKAKEAEAKSVTDFIAASIKVAKGQI